ncbi:MAG TPA: aldolase/citrate lyase family protein, partial [Candidatus Limnocylindrales bacterium]|nr:aldolase/citrate lyase family protein [Candidatus Limnocylindrales bacterium]
MSVLERLRQSPPRTWLFVPALRAPEWIPKAVATGTDAIIVDLEDATAPDEKERAREVVRGLALGAPSRPWVFVRVNAAPPDALAADVRAAAEAGAAGVVVPKAERPEHVAAAAGILGD